MNTHAWADWSCAVAVTSERRTDLAPAVETVRAVMDDVSAAINRFRPDSDLSRVNAAAGQLVPVSALTVTLVELALEVATRTNGAVTPTVGDSLHALGYDEDIERVRARTTEPVWRPVPAAPAGTVRVDKTLRRVGVVAGTMLDLGAVAKAYAVDESVRRVALKAEGPVLVSIGGDLAVYRAPEGGWPIAVSEKADSPVQLVTIDSGALATSSTLGRRWAGGRHHIIHPPTGMPAAGRFRTATVWALSAVEANLLSTWAIVSPDAAQRALAASANPALFVAVDGTVERVHRWPEPAEVIGAGS